LGHAAPLYTRTEWEIIRIARMNQKGIRDELTSPSGEIIGKGRCIRQGRLPMWSKIAETLNGRSIRMMAIIFLSSSQIVTAIHLEKGALILKRQVCRNREILHRLQQAEIENYQLFKTSGWKIKPLQLGHGRGVNRKFQNGPAGTWLLKAGTGARTNSPAESRTRDGRCPRSRATAGRPGSTKDSCPAPRCTLQAINALPTRPLPAPACARLPRQCQCLPATPNSDSSAPSGSIRQRIVSIACVHT
jgi:hypothetical protein